MLPLVATLPLVLAVLSPTQAVIAAAIVVLVVLILWKLVKVALKVAIIVGAALVVLVALRHFGVL